VVAGVGTSALLRPLDDDGTPAGPAEMVSDLAGVVAAQEVGGRVRWVWRSARLGYARLLQAGVRVGRCHDVELIGSLLQARDGRTESSVTGELDRPAWGDVRSVDTEPATLPFDLGAAPELDEEAQLAALITAHAGQLARIRADPDPAKFGLLVAAESAGALAAVEMSATGLPWRTDVHDQLLTGLLGSRPPLISGPAPRPAKLAELAGQITAALGATRPVNPESRPQLLRALAAAGVRVPSTRSAVLRQVDHPVIPLLLEYKELARLHAANGWSWLDAWVSDGRFRPEYVVGGVVSGRWASRGGGALQIPRLLRQAVIADPGWALVVADAAQLEPRVLAALAGDRPFAQAAAAGDLYEAVATAIGGDRSQAKIALLSAMYGGTGGDGGRSLALLRRRFPQAAAFVEGAARAGEEGRVVRSVLGRACPPPSAAWLSLTSESGDPEEERDPGAATAARARGRFTRNYVVQASAADWASVMLALLRTRLLATAQAGTGSWSPGQPELVFFQHDEVIVHCPIECAADVVAAVAAAAAGATRLVFGDTTVSIPMTTAVVGCYADAK
jgi:DNA polymerase family A